MRAMSLRDDDEVAVGETRGCCGTLGSSPLFTQGVQYTVQVYVRTSLPVTTLGASLTFGVTIQRSIYTAYIYICKIVQVVTKGIF